MHPAAGPLSATNGTQQGGFISAAPTSTPYPMPLRDIPATGVQVERGGSRGRGCTDWLKTGCRCQPFKLWLILCYRVDSRRTVMPPCPAWHACPCHLSTFSDLLVCFWVVCLSFSLVRLTRQCGACSAPRSEIGRNFGLSHVSNATKIMAASSDGSEDVSWAWSSKTALNGAVETQTCLDDEYELRSGGAGSGAAPKCAQSPATTRIAHYIAVT